MIVVSLLLLVGGVVWFLMYRYQEQERDRLDRERYTGLQKTIHAIKAEFEQMSSGSSWEYAEACGRSHTAFGDGKEIDCYVGTSSKDAVLSVNAMQSVVEGHGGVYQSIRYDASDKRTYIGYGLPNYDFNCRIAHAGNLEQQTATKPMFSCWNDARAVYFPRYDSL